MVAPTEPVLGDADRLSRRERRRWENVVDAQAVARVAAVRPFPRRVAERRSLRCCGGRRQQPARRDASDGTLWACYMDTFGDPYRHEAWPTCTASRNDGRTWAVPVRVAGRSSDETQTAANLRGYGSTALVAANGVAHPMWTDTRDLVEQSEEIYVARLPERPLR